MFTSAISDIIVSVTACGKQEKMSRMTLSERVAIEAGIYAHKTLTEIAERIGKSRRHVSEELRKNGTRVPGEHLFGKSCHNATSCKRTGLCGREGCSRRCCACREVNCQTVCGAFRTGPCKQLQKPPYVCNICTNRRKCKMDRVYYLSLIHISEPTRRS